MHWVRDIQNVLMLTNSGVNPFVYAWKFDNFRKAFKSILTWLASLRPNCHWATVCRTYYL